MMGCDFNFQSPCHFIDRFMHVLDYAQQPVIQMMSNEIAKFSLNDEKFLDYRPSELAATSVILSVNIFKKEQMDFLKENEQDQNGEVTPFHELSKDDPEKYILNTSIWNKLEVVHATGYSMSMLKRPLYDLAKFIEQNLEPNRLEAFYLDQILQIRDILDQ